jgi:tRNA pseudouridine55 synthase
LKWKGKPLYYYARKGIECPVPQREVNVFNFEILKWNCPNFLFRIHCTGGTYIRSIAHELGKKAGCGAHLSALRRVRSGEFRIEQAAKLEELSSNQGSVIQKIIPLSKLLHHLPAVSCSGENISRIRNGNEICAPVTDQILESDFLRLIDRQGQLLAIGKKVETKENGLWIHPSIVLR